MNPNPIRRSAKTVSEDARPEAEADAYIARNSDALNASIRRSRQEFAEGVHDTRAVDEIVADGRKRRHGS